MKNNLRRIIAVAAALLMVLSVMTGCSSKPKAEDATAYVKAMLDLMCTGDYDHSVKLADIEEGKETAMRDELINSALTEVAGTAGIDEETTNMFKDFIIKALGKAKYTVGEATATDDGGFDVKVTVEPLRLYDGVMEDFQKQMPDILGYDYNQLSAMSEAELNNVIFKALFKYMDERLENPTYADPQEVVVHYGLLDEEKNMYGASEADGEKVGSLLFSQEGL